MGDEDDDIEPTWEPRLGDVVVHNRARLFVTVVDGVSNFEAHKWRRKFMPTEYEATDFGGVTWCFDDPNLLRDGIPPVVPYDQLTFWERVVVAQIKFNPSHVSIHADGEAAFRHVQFDPPVKLANYTGSPFDTLEGQMLAELLDDGYLDSADDWPTSMTELIELLASQLDDRRKEAWAAPGRAMPRAV